MASLESSGIITSWEKAGVPATFGGMNAPPDEADEKIQYGCRLIMEAHRARSSTADNEIRALRQTVDELKMSHGNLTKKLQAVERELIDQQHRNQLLVKDNENLVQANRVLSQRCEKYKRLQQTFSEALENSGHEDDQYPPAAFTSGEYRPSGYTGAGLNSSSLMNSSSNNGSLIMTNSAPGSATMSASMVPVPISSVAPPAPVSPPKPAGKTSTAAAAANNNFDSTGKDGKQFFRVARTRLNFEAFNAFLTVIKKLNAHEFSREQATEEAKKIFGAEHQDLISDFQQLIHRHTSQPPNN